MTAPSITTSGDRLLRAHPDLASLLDAHGLSGAVEAPFAHTGFSGATLTRIVREDGESFVLKRTSISHDWIMRATEDAACRERFIDSSILPAGVRSPLLGHTQDGAGSAMLMSDLAGELLAPGMVDDELVDLVLRRTAELHATSVPAGVPVCDLGKRITLLTSETAELAASYGAPVASDISDGWRLFEGHAPRRAITLVRDLSHDVGPLLRGLSAVPSVFLHGDLKFDNVGFDSESRMWLIDWALTLRAPAAVELGWFLAINSRRMPLPLDDVMARYARHAAIDGLQRQRHEALSVICGLLLRGWRKALDAEAGDPAELTWWCERAEAAESFLS